MNERHQDWVCIGIPNRMSVIPITTRVHIDDLANSARADNLNHADMVLRKSQHVAGQDKTRRFTLRRKERDDGARRGRSWLLEQHREISAERACANLDMGVGRRGDNDGVSLHLINQLQGIG